MNGTISPAFESAHFEPWKILAYAAMVIVEVCWIAPWFQLLPVDQPAVQPGAILLVLGGILSVSLFIFRMEVDLEIRKDLRPWVSVGLAILSLLAALKALVYPGLPLTLTGMLEHIGTAINSEQASIPLEFYVFLFVFLSVYRGSALARGGVDPSVVLEHLRLGLAMSFGAGLLSALTFKIVAGQLWFLVGFLFAGLVGVSVARIQALGRRRGGRAIAFDRQRLVALLAPVVVLVLVAFGLALLLSSPPGIRLLSGIGAALQALVGGMIALIGLLMAPLLVLIVYLFSALMAGIRSTPQPNPTQNMEETLQRWEELLAQQTVASNPALKPILLWGTILVVFVILLLVARSRRYRDQEAGLQEVESLLSGEDLLRRAWKDLLSIPERFANRGIRRAQQRRYAARIRKIYADLLDLAAARQSTRPPSQTPLEYLPALQRVFPGCPSELMTITRAYLGVRYGEYPESSEQVERVEAAWKRLETFAKEQDTWSRRKR